MAMKKQSSPVSLFFLVLLLLATLSIAKKHHHKSDDSDGSQNKHSQGFDFFYFVQQWPGSYCDSRQGCCFPTTGKPAADFGIHGLWPNYNDGSYPTSCDQDSNFDPSTVQDLMGEMHQYWPTLACPSNSGNKFWGHEWEKHGTCSGLDEHSYFASALNLHKQTNLLQALRGAGIQPDGRQYSLSKIKEAIRAAAGFTPGIECNVDGDGNHQLYQIYLCVDTSGQDLIECPVFPKSKCSSDAVEFPPFDDGSNESNSFSSKSDQEESNRDEL